MRRARSADPSDDLPTNADILNELPDWGDGDGFSLRKTYEEDS